CRLRARSGAGAVMNARIAPASTRTAANVTTVTAPVGASSRKDPNIPAALAAVPAIQPITSATPMCEENKPPTSAGTMTKQHTGGGDRRGEDHAERQVEHKIPECDFSNAARSVHMVGRGQQRSSEQPMNRSDDAVENDELRELVCGPRQNAAPQHLFDVLGALRGAIDAEHRRSRGDHIEHTNEGFL